MARIWWVGLVAALVFAAGCLGDDSVQPQAGPASSAPPARPSGAAPAPMPTADTGALSVLVSDDEFQPVGAALVVLQGTEYSTFTDPDGAATFNGLTPGRYTVLADKPGFRPASPKGKAVDIRAEEISEVKLVLAPIPPATQNEEYKRSLPFKGFIACSYHIQNVGYSSWCGRGVTVQGTTVGRDPNDNSTHPWQAENPQLRGIVLEAKWDSSISALGAQLYARVLSGSAGCTGVACTSSQHLVAASGVSPLYAVVREGSFANLSKALGTDPTKFPRALLTDVHAHCPSACAVAVTLQQSYTGYHTGFYGEEPPMGWRVFA